MKHLLAILSLALLLLSGCKFETPLTETPTRDVDPALLGSWFSLSDGKPFDVYKLSAQEYLAIDDGEPFVCTHSDVAGISFVSCRQIKNNAEYYGKYAYLAYSLKNGELVLTPLNDSLSLTETSSAKEIRTQLEAAAKSGTALSNDPTQQTRYKKKD